MTSLSFSEAKNQSQNPDYGRIRVLIVDDQRSIRCKLQESLTAVGDIEIVSTADNGDRAIAIIDILKPDVVLMDIEMPEMDGIEITHVITQQFSQVKVLILTSHEKEEYIQKIIASGANGYILKQTSASDIVTAIRLVYKGYSHFGPGILKKAQFSQAMGDTQQLEHSLPKQRACTLKDSPGDVSFKTPSGKESNWIYDATTQKSSSIEKAEKPSISINSVYQSTIKQKNEDTEKVVERSDIPTNKNSNSISKFKQKPVVIFIISAVGIMMPILIYGISQIKVVNNEPELTSNTTVNNKPKPTSIDTTINRRVSALGRIMPDADIVKVSVPAALSNDRVAELLVKRGDKVKAGQLIAILDSRLRLQNDLVQAQAQVKIAQAKLEQVKAGVTAGEIIAQKTEVFRLQQELASETGIQNAIISRRQAELRDAEIDYNRYLSLYQQKAVSNVELEQRKLTLATAQTQIEEAQGTQNKTVARLREEIKQAQANLDKIAKVRPTDIAVAQSELDKDVIAVKKAQDNLEEAYIRAPTDGRIFNLIVRPGEVVGSNGLVAMAKTSQMEVVAEVYESDINQISAGQKATIVSDSFAQKLQGKVSEIGLEVIQQKVTSGEPGENLDRKVIEVRIELTPEDSQRVSNFTNLQVQVLI